ncbi:MAG TPA: hypothetical protein PLE60_15155 [Candidatus Latescibacteria bacterium]|nr:hypothetical protein [Candidatus Latescibacterota bacterium]
MSIGNGRVSGYAKRWKRASSFDQYSVYGSLDAKAHMETIAWLKVMGIGPEADSFLKHCGEHLEEHGQLTPKMQSTLEKLTDEVIRRAKKSLSSNKEVSVER